MTLIHDLLFYMHGYCAFCSFLANSKSNHRRELRTTCGGYGRVEGGVCSEEGGAVEASGVRAAQTSAGMSDT